MVSILAIQTATKEPPFSPWWILIGGFLLAGLAALNVWRIRTRGRSTWGRSVHVSKDWNDRFTAIAFPNLCASLSFLAFALLFVLGIEVRSFVLLMIGLGFAALFFVLSMWTLREFFYPGRWNPGPRWAREAVGRGAEESD